MDRFGLINPMFSLNMSELNLCFGECLPYVSHIVWHLGPVGTATLEDDDESVSEEEYDRRLSTPRIFALIHGNSYGFVWK